MKEGEEKGGMETEGTPVVEKAFYPKRRSTFHGSDSREWLQAIVDEQDANSPSQTPSARSDRLSPLVLTGRAKHHHHHHHHHVIERIHTHLKSFRKGVSSNGSPALHGVARIHHRYDGHMITSPTGRKRSSSHDGMSSASTTPFSSEELSGSRSRETATSSSSGDIIYMGNDDVGSGQDVENSNDIKDHNDHHHDDHHDEDRHLQELIEEFSRVVTHASADDLMDILSHAKIDDATLQFIQQNYAPRREAQSYSKGPTPPSSFRLPAINLENESLDFVKEGEVDSWNLNVLSFNTGQLFALVNYIFYRCHCQTIFEVPADKMSYFIAEIASRYLDNHYHNFKHGVDVCHIVYRLMTMSMLHLVLSPLEVFAMLVAALGHDVGHLGVNNNYLVKAKHTLAMVYNDKSPLENMHCSTVYEIVSKPQNNIFSNLTDAQWREARKIIVDVILGTDMSHHFEQISKTQLFLDVHYEDTRAFCSGEKDTIDCFEDESNRLFIMELILHCSDISNPFKPFDIGEAWAELVKEEFAQQGDREKREGLEVSPMMDRDLIVLCNMQMGFIEFVVAPLLNAFVQIFPPLHQIVTNLDVNYRLWGERRKKNIDDDEKVKDKKDECSKIDERVAAFSEKQSFAEELALLPVRSLPEAESKLPILTMPQSANIAFHRMSMSMPRSRSSSMLAGESSPAKPAAEMGPSLSGPANANTWAPEATTAAATSSPSTPSLSLLFPTASSSSSSSSRRLRDHYVMGQQLGVGGQGTVMRGVSVSDPENRVAIKVITPKEEDSFRCELAVLRSLAGHPHIVRLIDSFEEPANFYLVEECVEGGELFDRIVLKTHYDEDQARQLVSYLFEATHFCHSSFIVHRDLKPDNVLLSSADDDTSIKLCDFGLATKLSSPQDTLTHKCGTPGYMSPEVLLGKPYSFGADVWSLGVILYIILVGYPPFFGADEAECKERILAGQFEFHPEHWRCVSPEAKDLICKMLTVDQAQRVSLSDVLQHPWMSKERCQPHVLAANNLTPSLSNLKNFQAHRKLKGAVHAIVAVKRFSGSPHSHSGGGGLLALAKKSIDSKSLADNTNANDDGNVTDAKTK